MESNTTGANPPRSRLHGASLLKDIRALVEGLVYTHLNESVEEFINVEDYYEQLEGNQLDNDIVDKQSNGLSNNSTMPKLKPSENIMNLTSWLRSTFSTFANLPPKLAQTACISVCKHIARLFYQVLLGPQANSFSESHIGQLSLDLFQCEQFARSEPVPGLDSQKLWLVFADLRQLLDLFLKDDWNTYIVSRQRNDGTLYDRVPPSVAIKLLERTLDAEKKRTGFLQAMRKDKRGRRNKIEEVIRQLRHLDIASRPT